jgi:hypothetical protein
VILSYYGTVILPTKPRTPRHKGKVERGNAKLLVEPLAQVFAAPNARVRVCRSTVDARADLLLLRRVEMTMSRVRYEWVVIGSSRIRSAARPSGVCHFATASKIGRATTKPYSSSRWHAKRRRALRTFPCKERGHLFCASEKHPSSQGSPILASASSAVIRTRSSDS